MPIYEYGCQSCGHKLDALQKMSDEPLKDCPECGEPALKRLLSAPRFRLKGSGWYETDFKQDKQRNIAKADSDSDGAAKPDKKDGEKSDAKKDSSSTPEKMSPSSPSSTSSSESSSAKSSAGSD